MVDRLICFNDKCVMTDNDKSKSLVENGPSRRLTDAAQRALAEAEQRRIQYKEAEANIPAEKGGRGGLEPGRYGDWEIKGLTSDF